MTKGERIRQARIEAGISQVELAKKLNTTRQTISKYEKNIVTNIPSDRIEELCAALNTTPEYLMGWERSKEEIESIADIHARILMDEKLLETLKEYYSLNEGMQEVVRNMIHDMAQKKEA